MKLKKSFIALFCILLGLCFSANFNVIKVDAKSYRGEIRTNSYIYNKYGQRLKYFQGEKAYLKAGYKPIFIGLIKPIHNKDKRYFLNLPDSTKQNKWFPYRNIRGEYYYPIKHGGYVKARNVLSIDKYLVYSKSEKVIAQDEFGGKTVWLWNNNNKFNTKKVKSGSKLMVDGWVTDPETNIDWLKIENTDLFISSRDVKKNPLNRVNLLDYGYLKD